MLSLSSYSRGTGTSLSPSVLVDEAWHFHMTFTADYRRMCDEILGFFLHHIPSGGSAGTGNQDTISQYTRTLQLYLEVFG